jgi:hypothetical protein
MVGTCLIPWSHLLVSTLPKSSAAVTLVAVVIAGNLLSRTEAIQTDSRVLFGFLPDFSLMQQDHPFARLRLPVIFYALLHAGMVLALGLVIHQIRRDRGISSSRYRDEA